MGSGYYETPDDGNAIPSVLADIVDELQQKGLLTRTPDVDVFVNPPGLSGSGCKRYCHSQTRMARS